MSRSCAWLLVGAILIAPARADAQASHSELSERVMTTLRSALAPALPYPASDQEGVLPSDETSTVPWMVRPHAPGDRSVEVIANPLNLANQQRATRAMAQIQVSLESAQRRAEAQYERALAEARRTGRSQDVDGVSLADEGVAGARDDAETHVSIGVEFNLPAYRYSVRSPIAPAPSRVVIPGAVAVIVVPSSVYRDSDRPDGERFSSAESLVFFGALNDAKVDQRASTTFDVTASAAGPPTGSGVRSLVLRLRGNGALIAQILMTTDWARLVQVLD